MSAVLAPNRPALLPVAVSPEDDAPVLLSPDDRTYLNAQFMALLRRVPDMRMELTADGEIVVMPPAFSETGRRNAKLTGRLMAWGEQNGAGLVFDSSTGFDLPDGSRLSPDASWIASARWNALPAAKKRKFAQICPDFVIEPRSESDRLSTLQKKMRQYIRNGALLGFLVDPRLKRVEVYRPNADVQVLDNPASVSADPELPGFVLELTDILT